MSVLGRSPNELGKFVSTLLEILGDEIVGNVHYNGVVLVSTLLEILPLMCLVVVGF